jgi:hypothetical protein
MRESLFDLKLIERVWRDVERADGSRFLGVRDELCTLHEDLLRAVKAADDSATSRENDRECRMLKAVVASMRFDLCVMTLYARIKLYRVLTADEVECLDCLEFLSRQRRDVLRRIGVEPDFRIDRGGRFG